MLKDILKQLNAAQVEVTEKRIDLENARHAFRAAEENAIAGLVNSGRIHLLNIDYRRLRLQEKHESANITEA